MKKLIYILALVFIGLSLLGINKSWAQSSEKPNVLFIAVDDLKPMIGAYGDEKIKTPEMDKLAEEGTVFLNNHTQYAVCGPSRASLLTGLRPDRTKVWRLKVMIRDKKPDVVTLPQYFKQNGYTTAALGKIFDKRSVDKHHDKRSWSLNYRKIAPEFHSEEYGNPFVHYQSPETKKQARRYMKKAKKQGLKNWSKKSYALDRIKPSTENLDVPDEAYLDGLFAEKGSELLARLSEGKDPFFLAVGFKKPHLPFVAPQKYWNLYDRKDIELSGYREKADNSPKLAYHKFGELRSYTDIPPALDNDMNVDQDKQRELIHGYMASVSYIDAQVGKLMRTLEEEGLRENTIVVLWGDHGWHLGDHGLWCKHSNFEQATRSPLIVSAPGMKHGVRIESPTEFVDLFPTLADLSSLETPEDLDGKSLKPMLQGETKRIKDYAISQYRRGKNVMGYAIRTDRYRYVEWHDNDYRSFKPYQKKNVVARELYDYEEDPLETRSYIGTEEYEEVQKSLETALEIFLKDKVNS